MKTSLPSKVIQVIVSTIAWYNLVIQSRWRSIGAGSITLTSIRSTANIVQTHVVELLLLSKQIRNVIGMQLVIVVIASVCRAYIVVVMVHENWCMLLLLVLLYVNWQIVIQMGLIVKVMGVMIFYIIICWIVGQSDVVVDHVWLAAYVAATLWWWMV